jgi:hypothetical protein
MDEPGSAAGPSAEDSVYRARRYSPGCAASIHSRRYRSSKQSSRSELFRQQTKIMRPPVGTRLQTNERCASRLSGP